MNPARRLAAILAADVVGYSRLMGEDEAGTAKIVRERREAAVPIVHSFGGRLVKTMGDGVLLEFPSVVAAVECAILWPSKGLPCRALACSTNWPPSGQVRRTTAAIKREMKRRAAVEPVIGHVKADHRMDRNYLTGQHGDRINAVLAASGFNFHLLLRWLAELSRAIFLAALQSLVSPQPA
jgi:hypothetical protein